MESQPQNPEYRYIPENVYTCGSPCIPGEKKNGHSYSDKN